MVKRNIALVASILIVVNYLVFSGSARTEYPTHYSPMTNWLSDLGSSVKNPNGAAFYNLGVTITGLLVIFFFIGLISVKQIENKKQNAMLLLMQVFGVCGGAAMMMSAIFPIITGDVHSFWSAAIYILLGTSFGFSVAALRYIPGIPRWILLVGILVAIEDFIWSTVLNTYLMEWITVALFLGYVLILGIVTRIGTFLSDRGGGASAFPGGQR
jgi:hypothetical membrane protein